MLSWALGFFILALIAAVLGFGGIAAGAAGIAKLLFWGFVLGRTRDLIASVTPFSESLPTPSNLRFRESLRTLDRTAAAVADADVDRHELARVPHVDGGLGGVRNCSRPALLLLGCRRQLGVDP